MIEVRNVTKVYGKQRVLDGISVTFHEGYIYGLVGPNGCGKTTLMRCIAGFTQTTAENIIVDDYLVGGKAAQKADSDAKYERVVDFAPSTGIVIESPSFLPHYSGMKNLIMLSAISGRPNAERAAEVMRIVGLDPESKKAVGKYSLGMRQRLGIAQAIMENPRVLILDEPFNGLDADGVKEIHDLLQSLKTEGKTIILSSHSAADIEKACDAVYSMRNGQLEFVGAAKESA